MLMTEMIEPVAAWSAALIELVGIALIVAFALYALAYSAVKVVSGMPRAEVFHETRRRLAYGILLGLEFLVAADIIHTVAVELTWTSVGTLAAIVLIRTFLSLTLELELNGRWPWQRSEGR